MNLKDVSASLSTSGSKTTLSLVHRETQEVIQTFPVIPADSSHRNFIISTWLKSYRPMARKLGVEDFYDAHEPKIAETRWSDCQVVTDEDSFTIYAWVCSKDGVLYHVYVAPELRNIGVCTALTADVFHLARPWPPSKAELYGRGFKRSRTLSALRVNPYRLIPKEQDAQAEPEVSLRTAE